MSAYVVEKEHIDALVRAAVVARLWYWHDGTSHSVTNLTADETGRMLWLENVCSVATRYEESDLDELPGAMETQAYFWPPILLLRGQASPVEILKSIACYEYQTCEHDAWKDSEAAAFCSALRHHEISCLPGFEDAAWGAPACMQSARDFDAL